MTTSARRRTRQFLLPDGDEADKRESPFSSSRKRSQSLPLIIILGVIGYVLLVEDGGSSSSSSANLRRQLKVQNTGVKRQRQRQNAAADANNAARGRGKRPVHRRASAVGTDTNNRQLEAQAERSEAEQTNRQLGEGLDGSAKNRRNVKSKKRELFGISFLGNSDRDKVDEENEDELDELMDSSTVDADPDLQEALEALEETSSAGPPDETEDNSTPEGLMDDRPFEYIQVPREHEHAHQDSEVGCIFVTLHHIQLGTREQQRMLLARSSLMTRPLPLDYILKLTF